MLLPFLCSQSQIKAWSRKSNVTYIATSAQSWLDDYFDWSRDCCTYNASSSGFCSSSGGGGEADEEEEGDTYDYYYGGDYGYVDFTPELAEQAAATAETVDLSICKECDSRGR